MDFWGPVPILILKPGPFGGSFGRHRGTSSVRFPERSLVLSSLPEWIGQKKPKPVIYH